MQILQWLIKTAQDPPSQTGFNTTTKEEEATKGEQKVKPKDITALKNSEAKNRKSRGEQVVLDCSKLNIWKLVRKKDIAKACFYGTIHLKRVGSCQRREYFVKNMKMKKEDLARGLGMISSHKAESKVLPITDQQNSTTPPPSSSSSPTSKETDQQKQCSTSSTTTNTVEKKEKIKGDKAKTISKMKELLRWAAATKAEKGGRYLSRKVMQFRNRAALKSVPDDDQLSNDSPKISFRWEVESCSTISSSYSAISSIASSSMNFDQRSMSHLQASVSSTPIHDADFSIVRPGNWITTDSEWFPGSRILYLSPSLGSLAYPMDRILNKISSCRSVELAFKTWKKDMSSGPSAASANQHHLPDDVIFEILLLLSPKALAISMCVSKKWRSLISDPNFIKSHPNIASCSEERQSLIITLRDPYSNPTTSILCRPLNSTWQADPGVSQIPVSTIDNRVLQNKTFQFWGSCNGLVCVETRNQEDLYLWNPVSNRFRALPSIGIKTTKSDNNSASILYGIGYDESEDDHKAACGCFVGLIPLLPQRGVFARGKSHWIAKEEEEGNSGWKLESGSISLVYTKEAEIWILDKDDEWVKLLTIESLKDRGCFQPICIFGNGEVLLEYSSDIMLYNPMLNGMKCAYFSLGR
ncbi:OLC1v1006822C1 [Oldenlandia corymbosa var. corymbosa]|uniref:OLC1v1006822C1 n=1 Tax=Oldenlandia corymbosa var. corymbosa TaxID=529605 RepID=A0AAV1DKJ7_OLDCO|nr:OLC1v1006822C1 [Oldenlandia corymbosa var. corymbosa]